METEFEADCVFCSVLRDEGTPGLVAHRDSLTAVFPSLHQQPRNQGHMLGVPAHHVATSSQAPDMTITPLLIVTSVGILLQGRPEARVSCSVQAPSLLGRSPAGVVHVSNVKLIDIECRRLPPRALPKSGEQRPLTVEATVFHIPEPSARVKVPSHVNASGGGQDLQAEWVHFFLDIPIDDAERDAVSRAFITDVARRAASSTNETERAQAAKLAAMDARVLAQMVRQHRVGRFRVEFRVLDEGRLAGVADVDLEVVFKGSFFDQMLQQK